jgi:hypothetical protein
MNQFYFDRINWILQDYLFFIFITLRMKVMKNNPPVAEKTTTLSACDVVPPSKRLDTFCLSSRKAENILHIL